jgi:hypothetical protein
MVIGSTRVLLFANAVAMCMVLSSVSVGATEPLTKATGESKSFNTVPFVSNPSDTQRRELERTVDQCVKTVESEVPGGHFSANVAGGIVNTVGIDRERFRFWKCMLESGHTLAPINKSGH